MGDLINVENVEKDLNTSPATRILGVSALVCVLLNRRSPQILDSGSVTCKDRNHVPAKHVWMFKAGLKLLSRIDCKGSSLLGEVRSV